MESAEVDPTPWEAYGRFTLFWKPFIGVTILETPWSGDWALVYLVVLTSVLLWLPLLLELSTEKTKKSKLLPCQKLLEMDDHQGTTAKGLDFSSREDVLG